MSSVMLMQRVGASSVNFGDIYLEEAPLSDQTRNVPEGAALHLYSSSGESIMSQNGRQKWLGRGSSR